MPEELPNAEQSQLASALPRELPQAKKIHLAAAIAQGQSAAAWARDNGVPRSTAYSWASEPEGCDRASAKDFRGIRTVLDPGVPRVPHAINRGRCHG